MHDKAHAVWPVDVKNTGFAAFYAVALHHQHHNKVHTVAVRAFRGRPANAACGVNTKLVRFNVPAGDRFNLRKEAAQAGE